VKVYIAGTISKGGTLTAEEINANLHRFEAAKNRLEAAGYDVWCPPHHLPNNGKPATDAKTWAEYMRIDIAALVTCDGICPLPGWEESPGARLEMQIARELGFIVLDLDDLPRR
jgi:hypothetical protein